jgi:predicted 3-demethylubiquinone-9 3-methyltransferase (glyoxalase superfamily)
MASIKSGEKITPMLWYDSGAEEAAKFYASIFKKTKILRTTKYPEGSKYKPAGSIMTVEMKIEGQPFTLINGGPHFQMNGAVSFFVHCEDQKEIDHFWSKLPKGGGMKRPCGWLKDKWGVHWQIIPKDIMKLVHGKDGKKTGKAWEALMQMKKISIKGLKDAAAGK